MIAIALAFVAVGTIAFYTVLWLPRSAHAAFQRGSLAQARRRYRALGWFSLTKARRRAALLSRAGCWLAAGDLARADAIHAAIDPAELSPAERAVWLNNRACAILARSGSAAEALAMVEEAVAIRPDVPAVQHTRGQALVALGRHDDAIAVLDAMRAGGELPPRLEAERCRELATAWAAKGHREYADDYRERARRLAPGLAELGVEDVAA